RPLPEGKGEGRGRCDWRRAPPFSLWGRGAGGEGFSGMGEVLGIGCTHAPHLQFTDDAMANVLRRTMRSERTPEALRDPRNWPAPMHAEWGADEGLTAARRHREELLAGFR